VRAKFFDKNGFVEHSDLVFDIGVRDGKITRELLALGATVVCVEPKPEHVERMRALFGPRIVVVEAAVMDEVGEGVLCSRGDDCATMVPELYGEQILSDPEAFVFRRTVTTTTLDELIAQFGFPAFIKLDIEGAEYQALKGLTYPVPALCFEFGSGYIAEAYRCVELLGDAYEFNYVRGHHGEWESYWASAEDFAIDIPPKNEDGKWTWGNVFARLRDESH